MGPTEENAVSSAGQPHTGFKLQPTHAMVAHAQISQTYRLITLYEFTRKKLFPLPFVTSPIDWFQKAHSNKTNIWGR